MESNHPRRSPGDEPPRARVWSCSFPTARPGTLIGVNIDPSLALSGASLGVAAASLTISWNQFRLARTDQGGSGLTLMTVPRITDVPDVIWENSEWPNGATPDDYAMTVITVRAQGPFSYYDLCGCVWSRNGVTDAGEDALVHMFTAEDDPVTFHLVLPRNVLNDCHIGVTWLEAHGRGLRPNGLRVHCGVLGPEPGPYEWAWRPSLIQRLLPGRFAGRWRRPRGRMISAHPLNPRL